MNLLENIKTLLWFLKNRDVYYKMNHYNYELVRGPLTLNDGGVATCNNADFLKNPKFHSAYTKGEATFSWKGGRKPYHVYIACWIAQHVKQLEGDFVECGVYRGGISLAVMNYINFNTLAKKFYLLDTFSGIPEEHLSDEHRNNPAFHYDDSYDFVKKTFSPFSNVVIIKGKVPDTLPQVVSQKICYLSLDMNSVFPEIQALDYFWDKLVPGSFVLSDDYGLAAHYEQKKGLDEFCKSKSIEVLTLPTGQGIIIKP